MRRLNIFTIENVKKANEKLIGRESSVKSSEGAGMRIATLLRTEQTFDRAKFYRALHGAMDRYNTGEFVGQGVAETVDE